MTVSLIEITFYISALHTDPPMMPFISLKPISAVQHLYFIVAAPVLFLPLGIVLIGSRILPRLFGYLALLLATVFAALGVAFLLTLTLPTGVTAFENLLYGFVIFVLLVCIRWLWHLSFASSLFEIWLVSTVVFAPLLYAAKHLFKDAFNW